MTAKKKIKIKIVKRTPKLARKSPAAKKFGAITAVSTAPVAIGNSMTGCKSSVTSVPGGVRVVGRDFGFAPSATGTVTNWACTGGFPITPACMPTTVLTNFVQMYNKFKVNKMNFHYITSSSTASTGDVVFYLQKNSASSQINWTSSTFLPFVLSDPNNVIGPQWTNHTACVTPASGWKMCDYSMNADQEDNSAGDVFLMSKTSTTESPGYVVVDYDITFKELSYNPRAALVPSVKAQWNPVSLVFTGSKTKDNQMNWDSLSTTFIGGTTVLNPVTTAGEIYKFFVDLSNSSLTNTTSANFAELTVGGAVTTTTLTDGYTMYLVSSSSSAGYIFPTLEAAYSNGSPVKYGATVTYAETLRGYMKLVGWAGNNLQYSV